ncbi:MAG: iron ABC transporter permease [Acidimicrobiia bacterium]|nr:iron ABC transporter permease [Acidimicrobiia bacterium]MDX2466826.1 iron ABC transporter permease [Acidimicrobiia bacterium]
MVTHAELATPSVGWKWWLGATSVLVGAILIGAVVGPASIGFFDAAKALVSMIPGIDLGTNLSELELGILEVVRFPRVFLAVLVGAALSVSGAAYQGVFRNPLADPYLLGVAAGAGLGATLAIVGIGAGAETSLPLIPAAAFLGAIVGVVLSYGLGRTVGGNRTVTSLILAGVAVAAFLTAIQTFVQQRNAETLREVYDWILGRLATTGWSDFTLILPYMAVSAVGIFAHRRALDVMAVGDEEASSLGLEVGRTRLIVVASATLGAAAAVAVAGLIGFVGIIVPHAVRLVAGTSYRRVLPLSALFGGAFLVLADIVARSVLAPAEVPIGVVTAFLGAPFFVLVLRTSRRVM